MSKNFNDHKYSQHTAFLLNRECVWGQGMSPGIGKLNQSKTPVIGYQLAKLFCCVVHNINMHLDHKKLNFEINKQ